MLFEKDLCVMHDDNSTFVDRSLEAESYLRDDFLADLVATEDYLYIGLYKPFDKLYVELKTANTVAGSFTAEFSNGSGFTALDNFVDESKHMTRSGSIRWKKDDTWAAQDVNGTSLFWIRLKPSADLDVTTEIQGLNIVFSDDEDLREEYRMIDDLLMGSDTTHIAFHQAARETILQFINNQGHVKRIDENSSLGEELLNIGKWDLLESDQIRQASKFFALSKIFNSASDSPDGKFNQLAGDYDKKAKEALDVYLLTIDLNDNGEKDLPAERQPIEFAIVTRV